MLSQNLSQKSKKGMNAKHWIAIGGVILLIFACFMSFVFWFSKTVNQKASADKTTKVFVIKSGEGAGAVSKRLENEGLVKSYLAMILYLNQQQLGDQVQAGEYKIPQNLTIKEVANIITLGKVVTTKITIPEGWTNNHIATYLASNTTVKAADFLTAAKYNPSRDGKYSWLAGMSAGDSLEGFLYPDTYQLSLRPTANEVVDKMLANFDKKLTPTIRTQIKSSRMSTYEVVTLASIVEREAVKTTDRKLVAGVFLKRLEIGMPLQSDVTVLYAEGREKGSVNYYDTQTDSPYNTYQVTGLPAGPVCNPSMDSIEAVLSPTKSNYLYFLAAPNGTVYYAATVDQHNINKAKYLK